MTEAQTTNASPNDENEAQADLEAKQKRKKMLKIFAIIVVAAAILYAIWALVFSNTVETDNAYVGAETAEITSMVSGQVAEVLVSDTQQVKKGDVLAIIDNRDAKIAVAEAEAALTKAKRQYTQSSANSSSLSSQILVSTDDINSAKAQVAQADVAYQQAQQEFARRQQLNATGAISKEEFSKAQSALNNAKASVDVAKAALAQTESKRKAAQSNLDANEALIRGTSQSSTPDVLVAQAKLDQALLDLQRTEIKAPLDGIVARRSIQIGQRVAPGASLMKIVPIADLYVDANFKESQLKNVKVGQKATLTSDLYGKDVEYHGTVIGFSGGTGSAFALIPAQNATGNWIKVVQRLPVRIKLDPKELAEHPLRVGLSMNAEVDTSSAK
ncbi:HlyD family efflux transporter periplasmic adaptor subunit [Acinetobacter bereziniae]|jgi:membrane fusion protein (multidrug efflux system)|uniref:HlyD family secretion protein n=1 Tax=Acinetobacter bereziniae TaxID=106648 RepID=UPI000C2B834A|nr:HlyD family efflux transporter periplasmic adaptor subunit [Acinetobacter bereziniae]ATZ62615.1 efflux transporter periplasmic adaptor subunit [Acinetobacter bereziniae]MBJ8423508.1 HlyD family efflux transporter periplasmic adaptor subunit [Acinetobacter bereziniae]MCU4475103.1 HlyD family efflux transporter periplasmic adaptor subunit [Acinetobacter bereziniae]MCU4542850.1 HlyD family efflux transporter periplasmic adaptor subunit [Acinetobacter bereziniae]MCU4627019.1 HlyD family efflux 